MVKEAKCDNIMQDKTPLVSLDDIREDCIGVCQIGVLYDGGETFGQEEREYDLRMSTYVAKLELTTWHQDSCVHICYINTLNTLFW